MLSLYLWLGCLVALVYYILKKNYSYWESRNVPFEKPVFVLGNLKNVVAGKQHLLYITRDIYQKFKALGYPYVGIFTFHKPCLVIIRPDLIKKVLVKDFDKFANRAIAKNKSADPFTAHGLFFSHDTLWKNMRTKITPAFTSGKIKLMLPLMKECCENLRDCFERHDGQAIDLRAITKKYSVDIISSCAFGINSHCLRSDQDSEMMKLATLLLDPLSFRRNFSVFCYMFLPKLVGIFRLPFVDPTSAKQLYKIFQDALRTREDQNIVRHDLIDILNNLKKSEREIDSSIKFDDFKMASQAITFFAAGNDTTSSIISFALYELALNTDIQDNLREEIRETLNHIDTTYENIQGMKYLDMILSECLRKYPVTVFLTRMSSTGYTFDETGLSIDKGLAIQIPVAGLHYDPEYFPEPEKFIPERFNEENKRKIEPYTYLPFGDGPRNCIGQRFAILASKVALVYALKDFKFEVCSHTPIPLQLDPRNVFLQNRGGLFVKVVKA